MAELNTEHCEVVVRKSLIAYIKPLPLHLCLITEGTHYDANKE